MELKEQANGTVITVRVLPRAGKSAIDGVVDGRLRVRLTTAPVDGAANSALIDLFARTFAIPKSRVEIISGATGRNKRVLLRDVDASTVRTLLRID
ncbi:MAG TPA: DUF167 domain-containing protein [Nitrolancea sp.]|nr:DUF167 domain-containing protein [Nitrolancea sp.]